MIVTVQSRQQVAEVQRELTARGLWIASVEDAPGGESHLVIAPFSAVVDPDELRRIPGVSAVAVPQAAWPLVRAMGPSLNVGGVVLSSQRPMVFAGPCSVESQDHIDSVAARLAGMGVAFLRGGAFKPRTSPYSFQGHGARALDWLRQAADRHGLRVVTEVMSEADAEAVAEHADVMQIGSRNMQNFALLRAVGKTGRPVLLKRGMAARIDEWLLAGEYLLSAGCQGVAFCERGVRGFDDSTRNLLDLGAVALLSHGERLAVVVDPSHATGRRDLIAPLVRAAVGAGAAGVMVEVHDAPGQALSDGAQALSTAELESLMKELRLGREPLPPVDREATVHA
jgi:3-deoxy-7-phosphoheptulonate synthase